MPSGRTHDRIILWSLPLVSGFTFFQTRNSGLTLVLSAGFLFGGLLLGPDLDVRSIHYKRWGWFRWIWIPYRGSMRHRSPWSHGPLTGTTIRIVYLAAWLVLSGLLMVVVLNELFDLGWTWHDMEQLMGRSIAQHSHLWFALFLGLELGAMNHYVADWVVSTHRRFKRQGWQGVLKSLPKSTQSGKPNLSKKRNQPQRKRSSSSKSRQPALAKLSCKLSKSKNRSKG